MKKTITLALMAILMACYCHAAIYIVGNDPFGNWNPAGGVEMADNGDGTYTYSAVISGSVWFVFADGLSSDWTTFNNDFRYGPSNGDQTVNVGTWVKTQKAGDHGAYLFAGSGETYTITFDNNNKQFQIEGYVEPGYDEYTVAGAPASVFGTEWDINNPDNLMTKGSDGLYYWTRSAVTLQAGTIIEFKVVQNHDWATCWPENNWVFSVSTDGIYDLVSTFDPVTCLITLAATLVEEVDPVTYTVAGPQSVFGSDWDATDAANDMTYNGVVYVWKKQNVILQAPGFEFKVVGNHDWNYFEWPEGYGNNYYVSVPHNGLYTATITFDPNAADGPSLSCSIEENVAPDTPGDMNGDGEVTVADVNLLIDAILTSRMNDEYDFNGDGEINVADVSALINLLLSASRVRDLSGEILFDVDEGTVYIYYTGNENVTLTVHVDGVETPLQDGCIHLSEYGVHFIEVLAKARGYNDMTASFTYNWQNTDPEPEVTPAPEIFFDEEDDYVVVTAYGEGEVFLYVNGEQVSNPYLLERTDVEYEVYITAYAQEEGKLMSEEVAMCYIVMPRVIGPVQEMTLSPMIYLSQEYLSEYGWFSFTVTIEEEEPSVIYYRIAVMNYDGDYSYGEWMEYTEPITVYEQGTYIIEAYAEAPDKLPSQHVFEGFSIYPPTGKD